MVRFWPHCSFSRLKSDKLKMMYRYLASRTRQTFQVCFNCLGMTKIKPRKNQIKNWHLNWANVEVLASLPFFFQQKWSLTSCLGCSCTFKCHTPATWCFFRNTLFTGKFVTHYSFFPQSKCSILGGYKVSKWPSQLKGTPHTYNTMTYFQLT